MSRRTSSDPADAILIDPGAHDNRIGEETLAGRNVISGNQRSGVHIYAENARANIVRNNIIGLSPDGTRRVLNRTHGIDVDQGASLNIVGGTGALQRNVLSGNSVDGIEIVHHVKTTGNQVVGNYIGTDLTGNAAPSLRTQQRPRRARRRRRPGHDRDRQRRRATPAPGRHRRRGPADQRHRGRAQPRRHLAERHPIPNVGPGIGVIFHALRTTIGPGNVVTNQVDGVVIGPEADVDRNTITRNSIYGNTGLGIDVLPAGVNPNGFYPATARTRPRSSR